MSPFRKVGVLFNNRQPQQTLYYQGKRILLFMPLPILPMFSDDMTIINKHIAIKQHGDVVYYQ